MEQCWHETLPGREGSAGTWFWSHISLGLLGLTFPHGLCCVTLINIPYMCPRAPSGDADKTLHKIITQLQFVRQPTFQTFSAVIPVSRFKFVQPGIKSFGLGKGSLSLSKCRQNWEDPGLTWPGIKREIWAGRSPLFLQHSLFFSYANSAFRSCVFHSQTIHALKAGTRVLYPRLRRRQQTITGPVCGFSQ